jgi:ssDNA-binding Zn-finger/Zn-ribbon topoisomerase 1
MEKIFLEIPDAMLAYAAAYGAVMDAQSKRWYVVGGVPIELLNFVPKPVRGAPPESHPDCPKCGSNMKKRYNRRDGGAFWGCTRYPQCTGTVDWKYEMPPYLAEGLKPILAAQGGNSPEPKGSNFLDIALLKPSMERVVTLAAEKLGGTKAARRWLDTPKVALQGKKPLELMGSVEGCQQVEQLLAALLG